MQANQPWYLDVFIFLWLTKITRIASQATTPCQKTKGWTPKIDKQRLCSAAMFLSYLPYESSLYNHTAAQTDFHDKRTGRSFVSHCLTRSSRFLWSFKHSDAFGMFSAALLLGPTSASYPGIDHASWTSCTSSASSSA